jgi:hypothetical protein
MTDTFSMSLLNNYLTSHTDEHPIPKYNVPSTNLIVFQVSNMYQKATVVPAYTYLSLAESFGGFAIVVVVIAKILASICKLNALQYEIL